ncbi:hypothetical protein PJI16_05730 [Nitrospira sp. MA-1]|nr:hypothetical protein [Nitrospira sp. MA-1]
MYAPNPSHRNGNNRKSQWIIPQTQEIDCFSKAESNGWLYQHEGWGLHCPNGAPVFLGRLARSHKETFIAKFVNSRSTRQQALWHGYPADHQNNAQDIPETEILKKWLMLNLLKAAKIRKIIKGQPCSL